MEREDRNPLASGSFREPFKLLGVEFYYLAFFGIIVSFLGFAVENIARLIGMGVIDSRFHILPFISPYGLIIFAFHLLLFDPDDLTFFGKRLFSDGFKRRKLWSNLTAYSLICLFVFLGELLVGNLWDVFFGVELWNYESLPLSVTKYAGLVPTLGYGTGAYALFKFVYKPMLSFIRKRLDYKKVRLTVLILGSLIVLDTIRLMLTIMLFGEAPMLWRIKLW